MSAKKLPSVKDCGDTVPRGGISDPAAFAVVGHSRMPLANLRSSRATGIFSPAAQWCDGDIVFVETINGDQFIGRGFRRGRRIVVVRDRPKMIRDAISRKLVARIAPLVEMRYAELFGKAYQAIRRERERVRAAGYIPVFDPDIVSPGESMMRREALVCADAQAIPSQRRNLWKHEDLSTWGRALQAALGPRRKRTVFGIPPNSNPCSAIMRYRRTPEGDNMVKNNSIDVPQLIAAHLHLIDRVLAEKRFKRVPEDRRDDLRQECYLAMHDCATRFNKAAGEFASYASVAMRRRAIKTTRDRVECFCNESDRRQGRVIEIAVVRVTLRDGIVHSPADASGSEERKAIEDSNHHYEGRLSDDECGTIERLFSYKLDRTAKRLLGTLVHNRLIPPQHGELAQVGKLLKMKPDTANKAWGRICAALGENLAYPGLLDWRIFKSSNYWYLQGNEKASQRKSVPV